MDRVYNCNLHMYTLCIFRFSSRWSSRHFTWVLGFIAPTTHKFMNRLAHTICTGSSEESPSISIMNDVPERTS